MKTKIVLTAVINDSHRWDTHHFSKNQLVFVKEYSSSHCSLFNSILFERVRIPISLFSVLAIKYMSSHMLYSHLKGIDMFS